MASSKTQSTGLREFLGIAVLTLGLLAALSLISYNWQDIPVLKAPANLPPANYIGPAGAWFAFLSLMFFGIAAMLLPFGAWLIGGLMLFRPDRPIRLRLLWWVLAAAAASGLLQIWPDYFTDVCDRLNIMGLPGGMLGWLIAERGLSRLLGTTGAAILLSGVLAGCVFLFAGREAVGSFFNWQLRLAQWVRLRVASALDARRGRLERIAREEREIAKQKAALEKAVRREQRLARVMEQNKETGGGASDGRRTPEAQFREEPSVPEAVKSDPAPARAKPQPASSKEAAERQAEQRPPYELPPLRLLRPLPAAAERKIESDHKTTARILKETLSEFGIESDVTNIEQGPVVTRYELLPAPGVRVERISQLSNNLALTLKATSVRVQAPIPGKGVVGIEVPNTVASRVYLREILESEAWRNSNVSIPLILGKDVAGSDLIADLASMPHLLIAGATGSGKTVCINSILAGLLMSKTPDQLKMILVDPKIVEFAAYNNLPHLIAPVITDPKKAPLGLRWAIQEMESRYKLFARAGVRTIQSYNSKPKTKEQDLESDDPMPARIPYIVIVIDELADLMATAQADVENYIARLAQLSRAVGIHMILATQRPSVNVITGTIKANFPARISFQVAQKVDSRTILDTSGADKLLGKGDMLILPPGTSKLVRAQGAMTTDEDIFAIVSYIKERYQPSYEVAIKESIEKSSSMENGGEDAEADEELVNVAINVIRDSGRASVSMLQRRMRIGYNRAGRLMDILEDRGIVGPGRGSEPREILIDLDDEFPLGGAGEEEG